MDDARRERALRQIGRPRETVVRSTIETSNLFNDFFDQLAARIDVNGSEGSARRVIAEWAESSIDESAELANVLWRSNATSYMAGQLFVRDIELQNTMVSLAAEGATSGTFLNLPFVEAIRLFLSRRLVSPEEFDAQLEEQRVSAFTVRRALSETVRESMFRRLARALQVGGDGLREFVRSFQGDVAQAETPRATRAYLETVYRTNVANAYNAGRLRQQTDPDVLSAGLIWEYRTAGDGSVRESHAALDGKQWQAGDPEALRVYPPNSFNCRCGIVVLEDGDQTALDRRVDADAAITEGFSGPPANL